jgi:hypothetical protein
LVARALDCCVGDPEGLPHWMRVMGWNVDAPEQNLASRNQG